MSSNARCRRAWRKNAAQVDGHAVAPSRQSEEISSDTIISERRLEREMASHEFPGARAFGLSIEYM